MHTVKRETCKMGRQAFSPLGGRGIFIFYFNLLRPSPFYVAARCCDGLCPSFAVSPQTYPARALPWTCQGAVASWTPRSLNWRCALSFFLFTFTIACFLWNSLYRVSVPLSTNLRQLYANKKRPPDMYFHTRRSEFLINLYLRKNYLPMMALASFSNASSLASADASVPTAVV